MDNPFTGHNIRLDDGSETNPAIGLTIDTHPHFQAARRLLRVIYPDGVTGKSILDIGCLEGGYTLEFARLGMLATGIEVRESNYQNCLYVKQRVDQPGLTFVKDDAMNIGNYGSVDVVFANGILYHLDRPKQFLKAASAICRKVIFLQTHFATAEASPGNSAFGLSEIASNEGLLGRWYHEHDKTQREDLDKLKWASWSNKKSFWICKEQLIFAIKDVGFDVVIEQYDALGDIRQDMTGGYYVQQNRSMFVGIKSEI